MDRKLKITVICITAALLFVAACMVLPAFIKNRLKIGASQKGYTNSNAFSVETDNSTAFSFEYRKYNSDGTADFFLQQRGYYIHRDKQQYETKMPWPASDDVLKRVEELVTKHDAADLFRRYSETPFAILVSADPDTYYDFAFSKDGKCYTFSISQSDFSINGNTPVVKKVEAFFAELDRILSGIAGADYR